MVKNAEAGGVQSGPIMVDLSESSHQWRHKAVEMAKAWYAKYQAWWRLERRAVGLILQGANEVHDMLCHPLQAHRGRFGGDGGDPAELENPPEVGSLASLVVGLRKWMRWKQRAQELPGSDGVGTVPQQHDQEGAGVAAGARLRDGLGKERAAAGFHPLARGSGEVR